MTKAAVAAGHANTAEAARIALQAGGNAFDAAVAATLAACVAEPVLASLGGGGYLLARTESGTESVYDFFVQTPSTNRPDCDFYPITADFGTAKQVFHIGYGSAAVPGLVRGLFQIHKDLCRLPLAILAEPAIRYARDGITIDTFQAYVMDVIRPILLVDTSTGLFSRRPGEIVKQRDTLRNSPFADFLQTLIKEGSELFYHGEVATSVANMCREHNGLLIGKDFRDYRVIRRTPLHSTYREHRLLTNPPPSSGGVLIAFALKLLQQSGLNLAALDDTDYTDYFCRTLGKLLELRHAQDIRDASQLFDNAILQQFALRVDDRHTVTRGTTHISIIDQDNNVASLSLSNGEGCGHFIPRTGIMLNNMLGEQDLNPHGFHQWQTNQRMTSMMAPTIMMAKDSIFAIGSGGSNRLRTAILQVILQFFDFHLPLGEAIDRERVHYEDETVHLEGSRHDAVLHALSQNYRHIRQWPQRNLFFGGTHVALKQGKQLTAHGDPRRGGVGIRV